jgi:membrane protein
MYAFQSFLYIHAYIMYLFTKQFWNDICNDPREAVDSLKIQRSRFWYHFVKFVMFWRIVFSEYAINHCITRASALAFGLLLTLIPLVVTAALMLAGVVDVQPKQVEHLFGTLLPFAPETVLNYLSTFYINARKLRGPGIAVLIIVAIGLFGVAEESFNTIWKVSRPRSFFVRLITFTMVMVYIPILFFLSILIRHSRWFAPAGEHFFPIDILPFLLMMLAFTSLILFAPNTKVKFWSALLGGLVAGLLFELEREGFGMYVQLTIQTQTIYGTLGILPIFLVSLFVVSLFILFSAEVAYVHQNFRPLLRAQRRWDRRIGDYKTYLIFRILVDAVSAFVRKKDPPTLFYYIKKYELTAPQAAGLLNWLVHAKLLHCTDGKERYIPARDFAKMPIGEVLDEIKAQDLRIPATPDDYTREFIASLLCNNQKSTRTPAEQLTFEALVQTLEEGEMRFSKVSAIV